MWAQYFLSDTRLWAALDVIGARPGSAEDGESLLCTGVEDRHDRIEYTSDRRADNGCATQAHCDTRASPIIEPNERTTECRPSQVFIPEPSECDDRRRVVRTVYSGRDVAPARTFPIGFAHGDRGQLRNNRDGEVDSGRYRAYSGQTGYRGWSVLDTGGANPGFIVPTVPPRGDSTVSVNSKHRVSQSDWGKSGGIRCLANAPD